MFDLSMIADLLLAVGAISAAAYCIVLAGRLKRFNNLQHGMGGAVAVLSAQVDDMTKTLQKAQKAAVTSSATLTDLTERAESVSRRLELILASMHDLPESPETSGADTENAADIAPHSDVSGDSGAGKSATPSPASTVPTAPEKAVFASPRPKPQTTPSPESDEPVFLSRRHALEAAE